MQITADPPKLPMTSKKTIKQWNQLIGPIPLSFTHTTTFVNTIRYFISSSLDLKFAVVTRFLNTYRHISLTPYHFRTHSSQKPEKALFHFPSESSCINSPAFHTPAAYDRLRCNSSSPSEFLYLFTDSSVYVSQLLWLYFCLVCTSTW
jgi:hypothetical protein